MRYSQIVLAIFTLLVALFIAGCRGDDSLKMRIQRSIVMPDIMDNNLERIMAFFETIKVAETSLSEIEKNGFDPKSKNTEYAVGVDAFKALFGPEAFRDSNFSKIAEQLPEFNRYSLIIIRFKSVKIKSDRYYLNKKKTETTGPEIKLSVVLKDNVVVYKAPREIYHSTVETDRAFLQGLIDIFSQVGKLGRYAY